jgi:hypothetical protein
MVRTVLSLWWRLLRSLVLVLKGQALVLTARLKAVSHLVVVAAEVGLK